MVITKKTIVSFLLSSYITQILAIGLLPILTRLYDPSEFGELIVFTSLYSFIGTISTAKFENGILSAKTDAEANIVTKITIIFSFIISLALSFIVYIISYLFNFEIFSTNIQLVILLALSSFLFGVNLILTAAMNRMGNFDLISKSRLTQSIIFSLLPILIYRLSENTEYALIICQFISIFCGLVLLIHKFNWKYLYKKSLKIKTFLLIYRKHKNNTIYGIPHIFVDNIFPFLIISIISTVFGMNQLGYYNICQKFKMPLTVASNSLSLFIQRKLALNLNNNENKMTEIKFVLVILLLYIPVLIFAPLLTEHILGTNWKEAGTYALILSPLFIMNYIIGIFGTAAYLANKGNIAFKFGFMYNLFTFLPFGISLALNNYLQLKITTVLTISSIGGTFILIIYLRWLLFLTSILKR